MSINIVQDLENYQSSINSKLINYSNRVAKMQKKLDIKFNRNLNNINAIFEDDKLSSNEMQGLIVNIHQYIKDIKRILLSIEEIKDVLKSSTSISNHLNDIALYKYDISEYIEKINNYLSKIESN